MSTAKRRAALYGAIAIALISAISVWLASAVGARSPDTSPSPTSEPQYYVEGARPSPGADTGVEPASGAIPDGCVPWSNERPDVVVCGAVPPGWEPPPAAGDAVTYPDVCSVAAAVFASQAPALAQRYDLDTVPVLDTATCAAVGVGGSGEGTWRVTYSLGSASQVGGYQVAEIWNLRLDASGTRAVDSETTGITLSTSGGV